MACQRFNISKHPAAAGFVCAFDVQDTQGNAVMRFEMTDDGRYHVLLHKAELALHDYLSLIREGRALLEEQRQLRMNQYEN